MNLLNDLKILLEKERKDLSEQIRQEKKIRDSAPYAMESHSDTTRSESEKIVIALELQLKELDQKLKLVPSISEKKNYLSLWNSAKIKIGDKDISIMLVPEGLGGNKLGSIQTLSINSPLGVIINNKKEGDKFEFNEKKGKIIKFI